jgi:hypothetical protein
MSGGHADAIAKLSVTSYFRQSSFGDWFVRLRLTNGNGLVTTIFQVGKGVWWMIKSCINFLTACPIAGLYQLGTGVFLRDFSFLTIV